MPYATTRARCGPAGLPDGCDLAVVLLAISGVGAAFARMNSVTELWTTSFGVLILAKLVLLGGLLLTASHPADQGGRRRLEQRPTLIRFAGIEAMLMAAAAGIGVALTQTAYPRVEVQFPTNARDPAQSRVPATTECCQRRAGVAGGTVVPRAGDPGHRPLRRGSGPSASAGRCLASPADRGVVSGWLMIVCGHQRGYRHLCDGHRMTWHMVSHMVMSMVADPAGHVCAADAGPAVLPSSSGVRRGPREWIVWGCTPFARFITNNSRCGCFSCSPWVCTGCTHTAVRLADVQPCGPPSPCRSTSSHLATCSPGWSSRPTHFLGHCRGAVDARGHRDAFLPPSSPFADRDE